MSGTREALAQRADDEAAHEAGIAEAHFGLGRVDVDVDRARLAADEQRQRRVPPGGQKIHVGGTHRAREQLVAHRPAVDVKILRHGIGPVPRRQAGEALEGEAFALGHDLDGVVAELAAEDLDDAGQAAFGAVRAGGAVEAGCSLAHQGEAHLRMGDRHPSQNIRDRLRLGPVAFQEFQPCRRCRKEVAHLDAGAGRMSGGLDRRLAPLVDANRMGVLGAGAATRDLEQRDGADGGQGLAPKAEGGDVRQIAVGDFRGGVALDAEREIVRVHASAVVDDANQTPPTCLDHDIDVAGPRVDRVLDELLHGGGRALDDLACRDAVDEDGVEAADIHRAGAPGRAWPQGLGANRGGAKGGAGFVHM